MTIAIEAAGLGRAVLLLRGRSAAEPVPVADRHDRQWAEDCRAAVRALALSAGVIAGVGLVTVALALGSGALAAHMVGL